MSPQTTCNILPTSHRLIGPALAGCKLNFWDSFLSSSSSSSSIAYIFIANYVLKNMQGKLCIYVYWFILHFVQSIEFHVAPMHTSHFAEVARTAKRERERERKLSRPCLFNIFTASIHSRKASLTATWAMNRPWQAIHLMAVSNVCSKAVLGGLISICTVGQASPYTLTLVLVLASETFPQLEGRFLVALKCAAVHLETQVQATP